MTLRGVIFRFLIVLSFLSAPLWESMMKFNLKLKSKCKCD